MKTTEILNEQLSIKLEINKIEDYLLKLDSLEVREDNINQINEYRKQLEDKIKVLLSQADENKELFLEKLDNLLFVIGKKEAEIDFYKSKKKDIEAKIKSTEKSIDWIKSLIEDGLNRYGLLNETVKTTSFSIYKNKKPKLEIDVNVLPYEYTKKKEVIEADKEKINDALENGKEIKGVKQVFNMVIRGLKTKKELGNE